MLESSMRLCIIRRGAVGGLYATMVEAPPPYRMDEKTRNDLREMRRRRKETAITARAARGRKELVDGFWVTRGTDDAAGN
jgi:hypothetical protein